MAKKDAELPEEQTSKIEAIKNLIFGENIAQYNQEFDQVKKEINKRKEELEVYIEDVRKELTQSIDNLSTDIGIRISELEDTVSEKTENLDHIKVDKKTIGDMFISLGEKIKAGQ
ncbi:fructose 1,6-bisphosphatase [Leeuwenhoekiella sp. A16]|uniref:fructose 1,6-bisphosphatase n=1 Tax=unclassified Leeuwenhoekiella TaxID=2615029 RepID=UPI003A802659